MACSSKSRQKKKGKKNFGKLDLYALKDKYRFNENELIEFKQRFTFLSNAQDMLDKETFRENMGLLGLDSGSFLADRIFAVLDVDKDGHIQLEEYLKYFDILIYGSQDEKYDLTFRMIDLSGKGWFTFDEFKDMIMSMLYTWNNLTGSHYNINQNQKLDYFLTTVFTKFDVNNTGKVTSQNFKDVVTQEPQLLEIFDYFNQGIIDSVQPNTELDQQDLHIIDDLENLHTRLNQLKEQIGQGKFENNEAPRDSQKESKVKEGHRHGLISPHGELKTPVVSSLDTRIKKTIFFEPFREELEKHPSLALLRQHSEIVNNESHRNDLTRTWTGEYTRRKSDQNYVKNSRDIKTEMTNEDERNGKGFSKYKSIDVIYQEGNSMNSGSYHREHNPSFFKKEKEAHHKSQVQTPVPDKKIGEIDDFSNGLSPGDEDVRERIEQEKQKNNSYFKDHRSEEKKGDRSLAEEPLSTRTIQKKDTDILSATTPKSRKLDLHFQSTPIRPKILDTRFDNPDYASSVNGINDFKRNLNLAESVLVRKEKDINDDRNVLVIPESQYQIGVQRAQTNPVQLQQLTEQIDTLASETLKIIDELRNKKRNTIHTVSDIQEDQKKVIAQNIHKVSTQEKQSNFVSFGHQNWNLVLNMMLGIQLAVKSVIEKADNVTNKDFEVKFIFELVPKRTNETKDSVKICTFFDYAQNVFYEIRRLFGIKNEDYLRSIGPEAMLSNLIKGNLSSLTELTSTGKSGSFFYYSADGKYTLKTISREEFHFLRKILKNYYTHIIDNPHTLIIKFFGLHKIRFLKKKGKKEKVYFVIMANVFHTFKEIHVRYDLKGSTVGRYTNDKNPSVAKKDLNFLMNKEKIMLPLDIAHSFVDIIQKDSKFFEENHIIDYSLLMGIHYLTPEEININKEQPLTQRKSLYETRNINNKDGVLSSDGTKLYFFGIIDILTQYNSRKKAEYVFKRITSGKGISAVPPNQYGQRFRKFITSIVDKPKIEDLD